MKILNYSILLSLVLTSSSFAAFVNFGTGGARGHEFLVTSGARVATTVASPENRLVVGYLTTPGDASSFQAFASTTINNPLSSAPIGGFVNVPTANNPSATALAAVKNTSNQVAIWVYGQGGEQGLFTSPSWTAPASVTTEIDSSWDLNLGVSQGSAALNVTPVAIPGFSLAQFIPNTTITVTTGSNTSGSRYVLGAIPEPTTTMLFSIIGMLGLVRRKR